MIMKGGKTVSWLLALTVAIGTFTGTTAFAADSSDGSEENSKPTITLEDVPTEVPTEEEIDIGNFDSGDRMPIKATLDPKGTTHNMRIEVAITKGGSEEDDSEDDADGIQLLAKSDNQWYDIAQVGWGPKDGFTANDVTTTPTEVYLVASKPGTYSITVNLVDKDDNDNDAVLATTEASVTAAGPKITLSGIPTGFVPTEKAIENIDNFDSEGRTPIEASLDPKGTTHNMRIEVAITKDSSEEGDSDEDAEGIQLLAESDNKWYDIAKVGWGPENGFTAEDVAKEKTPTKVYLVASKPGTYSITVNLVDPDEDEDDAVLAHEEASVTAAQPVGDANSLKTACKDDNDAPSAIILTNDITTLKVPLEVKHLLKIDGDGHTLKFSGLEKIATKDSDKPKLDDGLIFKEGADGSTVQNLTVDAGLTGSKTWFGTYAIHAYKAGVVTLKDVTAKGGNAGILVNGSNVTLKGTIDVSGNGFGGIEVSQGEDVSEDSQLTIDKNAELKNSSESATNPTVWLVSIKGEDSADVFQGEITNAGKHFAVTNRVAKDDGTVQTQYFLTAGNAQLAPAEGWKGPAGEPGIIYAKDSQPFTFSFKESDVVKQKLLDAKKEVAPVLRLTIYLNGERGTGDTPENSYDNSVKIPLPAVSGSSVTDETIKTAIAKGLGNIANGQTQEKTNTIQLLEAAGVTFDENGTPTSVEEFRKNISYQDETWTVRLNTKKLLSDHISKIEFLVKPSLNLTADKTEENPFGTPVLQLGNNNYFKQDTYGLTQAYLYTIAKPVTVTTVSPLSSSVKMQWVKKGSAPNLPRTLTVNGKDVSGVTWTSSPTYDSAKTGTYTFTAALPEGYELNEGVTLPTITVTVYKPSDDDDDDDDKEENKPLNPVIPAPTPSGSFVSDTTRDFSVNGTYQFRITSKNGKEPTFVIGTPGVFEIQSVTRSGNDYFFKLRAIGAPGDKAGLYINNGQRLLVATVGSNPNYAKLDTGKQLPVKAGRTYQFRVTAAKKPTFVCGTGSAFRVAYAGSKGNDYFFKVTATGKAGDKAGFYVNGEKAPRTIGTIVA